MRERLFGAAALGVLIAGLALLFDPEHPPIQYWRLYGRLKTHQRCWRGRLQAYDPELGYAPVPGAAGSDVFPIGPEVAIRFDKDGLRVPAAAESASKKPPVLALGCSFTFGTGSAAEETFPFLIEKALRRRVLNAGLHGYGIAQMVLRARKLIPGMSPAVVIAQYSPWLIDRSERVFAPTNFGKIPSPYYTAGQPPAIAPPIFRSDVFDRPLWELLDSPAGAGERAEYLLRTAAPIYLYNEAELLAYRARRLLGRVPEPLIDRRAVAEAGYGELARLCRDNGAKLVIVIVTFGRDPAPDELAYFKNFPGAVIVDAESELRSRAPGGADAFRRRWSIWRGEPPVLVDGHPNAEAHRVIAEAILRKLLPQVVSSKR